ncbi:AraC family transcriptional regulator [Lacrimispora sphenoides]|uniref:Methylphosphotriester-DNA--protein-cysteine methyltransferase (N-terminal of Ada), contains Zn-binding and two AraC-type DNA-binding domains n=1 Tax=Lacrimispora sphenoides JCM 1415 TaxID=1297793 RepID=A0ABY1CI00_9FIRM|nr:AraC family transcriptional regulator [Lacrimispora sphenoides]SEU03925.1 Methylphosphotriester-DNA--protein-cysteine methyltransferase (N-terminal fragment of Ada), contains Zn-binding and two AraC-type DNA-binding domains [[Clostridium] sphenoides JCM 1415]SUY48830.1 AraC family transcriptional regulator [Lacrimispora sphenoides]
MKKELLEYLRSASVGNNDIRRGLADGDAAMGQRKLMDMCCQPHEVPIPDHCHNYIELVYMCSGSTVHVINGSSIVRLDTNDLLLIKQGTRHAVEPAGREDIAVHFTLLPEFFFHLELTVEDGGVLRRFFTGAPSGKHSVADYLHFHLQDMLPAKNLLENMIWSLMEDKKGREEINQATMGILIMELFHNVDKAELHDIAQYEEKIAMTAYQYLENNYPTATLEEFSTLSMQPSYYISRLFKRHYQVTFTECLQLIRMMRAANYLTSTSKPVEEIIAEVGYENNSYFHRLFKERYGLTPKQYRDMTKNQF